MVSAKKAKTFAIGGLASSALMLVCAFSAPAAHAAPAAWSDNATGLAIGGYDPVAYFTAGKPRLGHRRVEHNWGARTWRFASTGNRDAFAKHPDVYLPRFAGYDAEALARGLAVEGSPVVWAIHQGKVYLFRDTASMSAWRENPSGMTKSAEANWQKLSRDLSGTSRN